MGERAVRRRKKEMVIALHGLAGGCWTNWLLVRRLAAHGFEVENWAYPSVRCSIPRVVTSLAERFRRKVQESEVDSLKVVAYSMGGVVLRALLQEDPDLPIDRVVMLAPPNRGSPAATRMAGWFRWLCPPSASFAISSAAMYAVCRPGCRRKSALLQGLTTAACRSMRPALTRYRMS